MVKIGFCLHSLFVFAIINPLDCEYNKMVVKFLLKYCYWLDSDNIQKKCKQFPAMISMLLENKDIRKHGNCKHFKFLWIFRMYSNNRIRYIHRIWIKKRQIADPRVKPTPMKIVKIDDAISFSWWSTTLKHDVLVIWVGKCERIFINHFL